MQVEAKFLRKKCQTFNPGKTRVVIVDAKAEPIEWQIFGNPSSKIDFQDFQQVEIMSKNIQTSMLRRRELRDRPLYLRGVTPVSSLHLMEAQTIHRGTGYFSNQLRKKVIISIFTVCTVREGLEETTTGSRDNDSNKTSMAMLVMVSLVTTTLSKEPNPSPSKESIRQFFPHY